MGRLRAPSARSAWRRAASILGGLLVAASSRTTRAQSSSGANGTQAPNQTLALRWSGPGPELTCLGESGLVRAVNEYLGRDAFESQGSIEFVLSVEVARLPDRTWRAVLELRDVSGRPLGSRELRSATELCSSLNEPLVLAVALMVDSEPPPTPSSNARAPEDEPPPESTPSPSREVRSPSERWKLSADASLGLEAGLLPAPRPGFALGVELRAASWLSTRLTAMGFVPASVEVPGGASARFAVFGGALELCPGFGSARGFRAALCIGPFYGAMPAKSAGLSAAHATTSSLLAASAGLRAGVPLAARWSGVLGVTGLVPYRPDRFVYSVEGTSRELFRVSSVSLVATLGVSVMF